MTDQTPGTEESEQSQQSDQNTELETQSLSDSLRDQVSQLNNTSVTHHLYKTGDAQ